ncbi:unnamed protein product [Litomosoides sigmodontis]|uniref:Uncharacterized protein n=1 Tax=Litomosoides sigmodontis TaxID=42156 RepID=A0A3P7K8E7_LITSI|nr:unnamed protein product [Litomosoides sigmodontis]
MDRPKVIFDSSTCCLILSGCDAVLLQVYTRLCSAESRSRCCFLLAGNVDSWERIRHSRITWLWAPPGVAAGMRSWSSIEMETETSSCCSMESKWSLRSSLLGT